MAKLSEARKHQINKAFFETFRGREFDIASAIEAALNAALQDDIVAASEEGEDGTVDSGVIPLDMSSAQFVGGGPTPIVQSSEFRWIRKGKIVDLSLFITLDQSNTGFNYLTIPWPANVPYPQDWANRSFDDNYFQGSVLMGNYDDGGYGNADGGIERFQVGGSGVPGVPVLWFYKSQQGANVDRIWASVRYMIP